MFRKLLIANRGEIACRIADTAKRLGIRTVAVYSDADKFSRHVATCDEAVHLGAAAASESYLRVDRLIEACQATGADAVHPGYGFLAENAKFAEALETEGITFVGPTPDTIRAMGSKAAAKDMMQSADVPTTPGYQGTDQSLERFQSEAARIGYPVLLKAVAGGGGKGMRRVNEESELEGALQSAQREAKSSFGDDRFLIEKYVANARHLEVQVFGDGTGQVVHMYERDCSVQRRHQKVIEEAPAPNLPASVRSALLKAGVDAARAVNYKGAGTVEFLYDNDNLQFYFMEMNTRLQVEHPVSEMITGLDFVEWQLRIAAGLGLPLTQDEITEQGHAFEARLYAENPSKNFAPSVGTLTDLKLPEQTARIDSGVRECDTITPHYDPMIAKIITHGTNRESALGTLANALAQTHVSGVETNAGFLHRLTQSSNFKSGEVSTSFIETHNEALFERRAATLAHWAAAILFERNKPESLSNCTDPWDTLSGFRVNSAPESLYWLGQGDQAIALKCYDNGTGLVLEIEKNASVAALKEDREKPDRECCSVVGTFEGGSVQLQVNDGAKVNGYAALHKGKLRVWIGAEFQDFSFADPLSGTSKHQAGAGSLTAPLPGIVTALSAKPGDIVNAGDPLLVMEAMKMEHTVRAPYTGTVVSYTYVPGDQVHEGDRLLDFKENA